MFGGCNLVLAGDFWQFPAVRATSVFHNPWAKTRSFGVAAMQRFLWTHSVENMAHLFELTKEQRCVDPWLSFVLQEARHGRQSQEVWSFLHGTQARGSAVANVQSAKHSTKSGPLKPKTVWCEHVHFVNKTSARNVRPNVGVDA